MIVDSSALVAIALEEPAADDVWAVLAGADARSISAANLLETWMVLDRRGRPRAHDLLASILDHMGLAIEPLTFGQVEIARDAWQRFGKGSGHPAHLNFGDCIAYALARHRNEPLLFVGNDFAQTDISRAA